MYIVLSLYAAENNIVPSGDCLHSIMVTPEHFLFLTYVVIPVYQCQCQYSITIVSYRLMLNKPVLSCICSKCSSPSPSPSPRAIPIPAIPLYVHPNAISPHILSFITLHEDFHSGRPARDHISPERTVFPMPAISVLMLARLLSSNSLATPCTRILRSRASALVKSSATEALQSRGETIRDRKRE